MAIDETLLQLALELAADYDATLDTAEGSTFRTQFLDPLLTRVGGSPLDVDTETFLVSRLNVEIPDVDTVPFSAMRDLVIRACTVIVEPYRREVSGIKAGQSLNNYLTMTRDEVDSLLGNYFTSLREGGTTGGTVRMYFPSPQSAVVTPTTQFSTGAGLNFFPTTVQSISSTQMGFQQEGDLYYFDVLVGSEGFGTDYNVAPGAVSSVVGISGATRVSNVLQFADGYAEETKEEGVARTQKSITIRNLITARGVSYVLPDSFPAVDTLQVIGKGDVEMDRDIVYGPFAVSSIPGGFTGRDPLSQEAGQFIHIGGLTDVYVYQKTPDTDDLDIENLTDKGVRVHSAQSGFTDPGVPTTSFQDHSGFFQSISLAAGDMLLVGADTYTVATVVSETELDVSPGTLAGGQFNLTYEVVRQTADVVTVPLYDLIATDSAGTPLFDTSGDPTTPFPGSPVNAQLLTAGSPVAKVENKSSVNIATPLIRVVDIEFLDPITLEESGDFVPMKDLLLAYGVSAFTGGGVSSRATGTARLYFRDAVNCYVTRDATRLAVGGYSYWPVEEVGQVTGGTAGVPDEATDAILVAGDYTATVAVGDRIEILSGTLTGETFCILSLTYDGMAGKTTFTVREDLSTLLGAPEAESQNWVAHVGILEANMSAEASTGMYYLDVDVEATATGAAWDQAIGATYAATAVNSEGWSLKSTSGVLSYSTRDLPYLQMDEWVNDTTQLFVTFTAPAIRVAYEYASDLSDIQTFADSEDNRIVAEDVLIRHFVPSYVRTTIRARGISAEDSKAATVAYINALDPTDDLEVSDVSDAIYTEGGTKVQMPVTLTGLTQSRERTWSATFSEDTLTSSRIQHFIADSDFIITVEL